MQHISRKTLVTVSVLALALASGCASISKDELAEVRSMAEKAMTSAETAGATADQAMGAAQSAMEKADAAMDAANGAQACCNANSEKIDRAFQRSMTK